VSVFVEDPDSIQSPSTSIQSKTTTHKKKTSNELISGNTIDCGDTDTAYAIANPPIFARLLYQNSQHNVVAFPKIRRAKIRKVFDCK
jgi:hypothetical protein